MDGRVGGEPPPRLRELALAAAAVPTPGLVPGDGDVDEPLEEVALLLCSLTPDVLDDLVRGVVLAASISSRPRR